jgi:hypothetical protein
MDKNELQAYVVSKLINKEFDSELDTYLVDYMQAGTILGNLARINLKFSNSCDNLGVSSFNDFNEWQFEVDDDE